MSASPILSEYDLICPITLNICRDPVLAGDGHVYERIAIMKWIAQEGTSPLTRESLNTEDLRTDEHLRELCQSYRSNTGMYSCRSSVISLSSISQTDTESERQLASATKCGVKLVVCIFISICLIASCFIIGTAIIVYLAHSSFIHSSLFTTTKHPSTAYTSPSNCTLPTTILLFSLANVQRFESRVCEKLYRAVSNETMLTFVFQHNTSYWCLNNVSFFNLLFNQELITNGNFEDDLSNGYFRCFRNENNSIDFFSTSSSPYNGGQSFCQGGVNSPTYLSQKLHTTVEEIYLISFRLQNHGDAPNSAKVMISYS